MRHLAASGTDRLAASQFERSEVIVTFERHIARLEEENERRHIERCEEQDRRIEKLEKERLADARYEQDYRHGLNNRMQLFMLCYDAAHELLVRVMSEWKAMFWTTCAGALRCCRPRLRLTKNPMPRRGK